MGAPAISPPDRRSRPARATKRPATKQSTAKARPAVRTAARTSSLPRAKSLTTAKSRPASKPRPRSAARNRAAASRSVRPAAAAAGVAMQPVTAIGRTAVAFGGLADSPVVMGMSRSRLWIGVLGLLLGGIVALNVWGLGLSASGSEAAVKIDALQSANSVMQGRLAKRLSSGEVEAAAQRLGLAVPAADAVIYLGARRGDAAKAAKRLASGELTATSPTLTSTAAGTDPTAVTDPPAPPSDPAAAPTGTAVAAPVDAAAPPADPAATPAADPTTVP